MKRWIRPFVSFGLLALLLWFLPWDQVREAFGRLPLLAWGGVLMGFLLGHRLGVEKWRMLVNAGRATLNRADAVRCYAAGLFTNMCLPSIVGGDVLRAALATKATGRPEAAVLGGLADRVSDTIALLMLLFAGGALAHSVLPGWGKQAVVYALVLTVVVSGILLPLMLRRPLKRWPARIRRPAGRALVALRRLVRQPRVGAAAFVLSIIIQSSFVLLNAWMAHGIGVNIPLVAWFLVWPLSKLAALVPVTLGGLGVREATLAALLVPFGVTPALGVVTALLWQTVLITGGLLSGALWWLMTRRQQPIREPLGMTFTAMKHG
jgi:glycosyltransferase 2 family protein